MSEQEGPGRYRVTLMCEIEVEVTVEEISDENTHHLAEGLLTTEEAWHWTASEIAANEVSIGGAGDIVETTTEHVEKKG